jgi:hypothetical protein
MEILNMVQDVAVDDLFGGLQQQQHVSITETSRQDVEKFAAIR